MFVNPGALLTIGRWRGTFPKSEISPETHIAARTPQNSSNVKNYVRRPDIPAP